MNEKEFLKRLSPPSDEDLVAGLALVPQHVRDALPRTGECRDRAPRIELYAPWGVGAYAGWRWHVISVDRADDNIAYCRVQGLFDESGAVHLDDIASIRGPRGQRVVRVEGHTQGSTGASSPLPNDLTPSARPQTRSPDRHGREFWQSATVEDALLCIRDEAECDELQLQAASHSPNPSVIEAVCKAGANVQSVDQNEKTAQHQAA